MSLVRFTPLSITPDQQRHVEDLYRGDGWSMQPTSILKPIFPEPYLQKIDSVVNFAGPTSSGGTCLVFNALRLDRRCIDQDPVAFFLNSTGVTQFGVHVHHGTWQDRSWTIPTNFRCGDYFLINPPGSSDILPLGVSGAISASLSALRSV